MGTGLKKDQSPMFCGGLGVGLVGATPSFPITAVSWSQCLRVQIQMSDVVTVKRILIV